MNCLRVCNFRTRSDFLHTTKEYLHAARLAEHITSSMIVWMCKCVPDIGFAKIHSEPVGRLITVISASHFFTASSCFFFANCAQYFTVLHKY
jgi:hypothetical protein